MIYGIGASWNPEMSQYNRDLKRGLADVKGLSFAYRLNTWGPKNGPAMLPANTFRRGYTPSVRGLAGPLTWVEGILGIEAPADILTDATNILNDINSQLNTAGTTIATLLNQAHGYDSVAAADVQSKAQACEAEAAGLQANLATLQTSSQNIATSITTLSGTTDKVAAQTAKDAANNLSAQVSTFMNSVAQLQSDVSALVKYAQSGPGAVQTLENAAVSSISTLTWLVGGGLAVYFLLPSFLPRLASGIRKSRSS
jgi:hypothetical protein